ncbi:hypothetical protein FPQ18DRAFT_106384 [Pyronema domesticum]|nr:hypothetical protein FPQ18DRAFT_106384 [Pyronema domesticum]
MNRAHKYGLQLSLSKFELEPITVISSVLPPAPIVTPSFVPSVIPTAPGLATTLLPATPTPSDKPITIFPPGGTANQDISNWIPTSDVTKDAQLRGDMLDTFRREAMSEEDRQTTKRFSCKSRDGKNMWLDNGCWEWRVLFVGIVLLMAIPGGLLGRKAALKGTFA